MPRLDDAKLAAELLNQGEIVAIPTETVYGLAASMAFPEAVAQIFTLKGRPTWHPLIVHLGDADQLPIYAKNVSLKAKLAAQLFWPGPLTMVFEKTLRVPTSITGGQNSVAIRVPRHPLALAVLQRCEAPLVAPSANRFGHVSPTDAAHVISEFGDQSISVLDGGGCEIGLESTIVDVRSDRWKILRPGAISADDLRHALDLEVDESVIANAGDAHVPGALASHYAPRCSVSFADEKEDPETLIAPAPNWALLSRNNVSSMGFAHHLRLGNSSEDFARDLYRAFRQLEEKGVANILVLLPNEAASKATSGASAALRDRVRKASAPRK